MRYDVLIVGAGPAGSTCAALCAQAGLRTLLIERTRFPREKVCGDCLNPSCWPVLDRLGISERLLRLPHAKLASLELIDLQGCASRFPLRLSARGEIAIKRIHLDALLLDRALEGGAEVVQGAAVTRVAPGWEVQAGDRVFHSRILVAADGRNSSVARLLNLLPPASKERVAWQTHVSAPTAGEDARVTLRLLPGGYCGLSDVGEGQMTVCLVGRPRSSEPLKIWASEHLAISLLHPWRTITPLRRRAISPGGGNHYFIGDVARVVEPFTGEGIYYALASAELAARHIIEGGTPAQFAADHARLYRGRLWVNQISRTAVLHPRLGDLALRGLRRHPGALRFLARQILGEALV